jgi:hypothetical protein
MRPINQTPQSADGAYERETIINFCDAEKPARIIREIIRG